MRDYNLSPEQILQDDTLNKQQKINKLQEMAYDLREMGVADSENMPDIAEGEDNADLLQRIQNALLELGVPGSDDGPTEQG